MPYENEHACRLHPPGNYDKFRRANGEREHEGRKYDVIYGRRKGTDKWEDQAFRYPKGTWGADEARSHCQSHDGTFEAASGGESESRHFIIEKMLPAGFVAHLTQTPWAICHAYIPQLVARGEAEERTPPELLVQEVAASPDAKISLDLPKSSDLVAVLPLYGVIERSRTYWGDTFTDEFSAVLKALMAEDRIGAVVLDVDSPGGGVYGVAELAEQVRAYRGGPKPVYAVASGMMASAAYWIGSAASKAYVAPSGQAGSIGVWSMHVDMSGRLAQLGLKVTLVSAGRYKTEGHPFGELEAEAQESIQTEVNHYYGMFADDVARFRNRRASTVRKGFGEGRLLVAERALDEGLVDGIATLDDVLAAIVPKRRGSRQATALADLALEAAREPGNGKLKRKD